MDAETWNNQIAALPGAHILQSWEWGQLKQATGWQALPQTWRDEAGQVRAAALVLERSVRFGGFSAPLRVLYVPRGPLLDWGDAAWRTRVLDDLQALARRRGAIFLKIDPEAVLGTGIPGQPDSQETASGAALLGDLTARGWRFSDEQVQFRNTVWLDLSGTEEDWLARMKQKTRYNLRLAGRKGVSVRLGRLEDLPGLYRMYAETSLRDGFVIRPEGYYLNVWRTLLECGKADVLLAEVEGEPVAGLVLFYFGTHAWYFYGMSREAHRELMPNYLLQWEAMRQAKRRGCAVYDLWGAPDEFDETDLMWGVFRFKEGLGGRVVRTLGAWDYPVKPWLFTLYTRTLPRLLDGMRRRGKQRTRQEVAK